MIGQCLEAAGVTKVVWIDDNFAKPTRAQLVDRLARSLSVLYKKAGHPEVNVTGLGTFNLKQPEPDMLEQLDELQAPATDQALESAVEEVEKLSGVTVERPENPDLTLEEIKELLDAFGDRVTKFSLGEWTGGGSEQFKTADRNTLFLIDKEFHRENSGYDGLDILKELSRGEGFCIMFTCHCQEGEQEERRLAYSAKESIQPHRFSVISKLGAQRPISNRVAQAMRAVFIHRYTGDLAAKIADELAKSASQVVSTLMNQSISDIDQGIFENSISEGASEFDVLLRIFALNQRRDTMNAFEGAKLHDTLIEMRRFRKKIAPQLAGDPRFPMEQFRKWRQIEVCTDGALINAIHSPLHCGDIFECVSGSGTQSTTKSFMLLAQPCDLMVRENGERVAEAGLFVLLTQDVKANVKESRNAQRFHELSGILPENKIWRADFLNAFIVDLSILDACVFNKDGAVTIARDTSVAEYILTDGYAKRLQQCQQFLSKLLTPRSGVVAKPLSVGIRGNKYRPTVGTNDLAYPIKRTGRLDSSIAHSILAAWASYQARAALDHDFARGGAEPAIESTEAAPAEHGPARAAAPARAVPPAAAPDRNTTQATE